MKKFALLIFGLLFMANISIAQTADANNNEVSQEEYRRYIDSKMEMEFRNATIEALNLTREEIIAFDPVFSSYMTKKERLVEKKVNLIEDFREEMAEDDSEKNQAEDRSDFIEDYWEIEIAEMELKKDYYDILEDKIAKRKAINFFLWEEAVENQLSNNVVVTLIPTIVKLKALPTFDKSLDTNIDLTTTIGKSKASNQTMISTETQSAIESFDKWVVKNKGQVDLSHEYTSNGLTALVNTIASLKTDLNVNIPEFTSKKAMIMKKAQKITVNPYSDKHADYTREAFVATAELMSYFNNYPSDLMNIANSINKETLMTKQANTLYRFFETANTQLKKIHKNSYSEAASMK